MIRMTPGSNSMSGANGNVFLMESGDERGHVTTANVLRLIVMDMPLLTKRRNTMTHPAAYIVSIFAWSNRGGCEQSF